MKSPGYTVIPPAPTAIERRDRLARELVEDFARTDPSGQDLADLKAEAIRREPREWWRKQFMRADPLASRELAAAILKLFEPEAP